MSPRGKRILVVPISREIKLSRFEPNGDVYRESMNQKNLRSSTVRNTGEHPISPMC